MGNDFISMASLWISNKKFMVCNIVSSAVLWVIWKLRNALCFQGVPWMGMKMVFAMLGRMLRNWMPMFTMEVQESVEQIVCIVEAEARSAPQIRWRVELSGLAQSTAQPSKGLGSAMSCQCNRA